MKALEPDAVTQAMSADAPPTPRAQRAMTATWRLVVLLAVIAGIALILANSLRVYFAQAAELTTVRGQISAEQDRIADLQDRLNRWEDPDYVKTIARVRLGWVMPGEVGYHVIGADGQPLDGAAIEQEITEPPGPWWETMWTSVKIADQPGPEATATPSPSPTPTPSTTP